MKYFYYWAIALFSVLPGRAIAQSFSDTTLKPQPYMGAYTQLQIPDLRQLKPGKVITVAVIDDAFNLNHKALKPYLYTNIKEVAGNGIDDDGNGYTDDVTGFDVSDNDMDVSIIPGRESFFYHGTMIAGTIALVAEKSFGPQASRYLKILPVKALADKAQKANMEDGYAGIAYAVKQHADIIVCAWNGGKYDKDKYQVYFNQAQQQGILILCSAGNFYSEKCDFPAALSSVYVVSAIDTARKKMQVSNFGKKTDLSASGEMVYAPLPLKDNTYSYNDGTSAAVSLVAGCAAVLKLVSPKAGDAEIMQALKNTATPIDTLNRYYAAKLGAGVPNLNAAVKYLLQPKTRAGYFSPARPKGEILIDNTTNQTRWELKPQGDVQGFIFNLRNTWNAGKAPVNFYSTDSLMASYTADNFPASIVIKANPVWVQYDGKKGSNPTAIDYTAIPMDSTTLYCRDTRYYETPAGDFGDGSGTAQYANNCACKWQIKVPAGYRVKVEFDEFNTQAKTDFVWVFEGTGTLQENILAKFSGPGLPPAIVSGSNEVLIWFVTDQTITNAGWHLKYSATKEDAGVKPPPGK